ncbi:unnamed protein product [Cylicostephanus goldi]|uniref:RNA polymerase III subunit RPC82-related helix-turn-helix domain-containing protein n=1 Tax=Cylicostephanus goldi TaxID=71465 RepID=A0A3P7P5S7_CYLGO|nr:unnamed protein product [Cylicostephanus goldi]
MAGHFESELCQVLLEEHFGKTVSIVGAALLREAGPLPAIMLRLRGQVKLNTVKEKFVRLTESQFIIKCPPVVSSLKGCPQFETSYDPYIMPEVILQGSPEVLCKTLDDAGESRKRKQPQSEGDEGIYWRMNWMRFDRYIRDEMTLDLLVPKV